LNQLTPFDTLLDMGGRLWPERHHYLADTLWSNSLPAKLLATLHDRFMRAPSLQSLAVLVFSTGAESAASALPDAAFSMTASTEPSNLF